MENKKLADQREKMIKESEQREKVIFKTENKFLV
jgi:hypothetical protein